MTRFVLVFIGFGLLGLTLAIPPARAQLGTQWENYPFSQQTMLVWREMALCAQQAQNQYPDHTPEANAKREQARLNCERVNHLPTDPGMQRRY